MTQIQWQHLESVVGAMTPEDKQRLAVILSAPTSATPTSGDDAIIKTRESAHDAQAQLAVAAKEAAGARDGNADSPSLADFLAMSRDQLLETLRRMAADQERIAERRRKASPPDATASSDSEDSFIGCMAHESDLLDEIMEGVYLARETHPFRTPE